MAISELCKFEVRDQINHYVSQGMSQREASRILAEELAKILGERVSSETLRTKAHRANKEMVSNDTTEPTTRDNSKSEENQTPSSHGGKRHGAGRKPKYAPPKKEEIISEAFRTAFEAFFTEIKNAKALKWKTTSKEAALQHIKILFSTVTIGGNHVSTH